MDLPGFRLLLTPTGQSALAAAAALQPQEPDFLPLFSRLSRAYPPELARAALETAILRREAQSKFPRAAEMYFTRPALEQATSSVVAEYRAGRYSGLQPLFDLGCSIGGDTLALAALAPTTGLDLDPLRLAMARANLGALLPGGPVEFLQADLGAPLPLSLPAGAGLFFDPARRSGGKRAFSVGDYQPPLETVRRWLGKAPALGVKISPGVDLAELASYDAEIEFISLNGDLKEAVLWFGPLRRGLRRATLLPSGAALASDRPYPPPGGPGSLPLQEPGAFLYEPDPAVLRAGLVADLGERLGAAQLDPEIAYLTAGRLLPTPFARAYTVEAWFPFQLKRLRQALRERGVGRVTVKKRGSPLQPEALIRDLRLSGDEERLVFLTHLRGQPVVILSTGRA